MDWFKDFATKWGWKGLAALAALIWIIQNAGLLPLGHEVFGGGPPPQQQGVTTDQMERHLEQTKETHRKLGEITDQLRANGNSNAVGLRVLCLQNARTDQQKSDCARIQ
jgi:hypothetical protein